MCTPDFKRKSVEKFDIEIGQKVQGVRELLRSTPRAFHHDHTTYLKHALLDKDKFLCELFTVNFECYQINPTLESFS